MQESGQNHTSAASGVAYAETRGATDLLNWTEAGPKILLTSVGLRDCTRFSGMSAAHVQTRGHVIIEQGLEFTHWTDGVDGRAGPRQPVLPKRSCIQFYRRRGAQRNRRRGRRLPVMAPHLNGTGLAKQVLSRKVEKIYFAEIPNPIHCKQLHYRGTRRLPDALRRRWLKETQH